MRDRWEYEVMPSDALVGLLEGRARVSESGEGYVSKDAVSSRLDDLLKRGFRWVRTEHGAAVFERKAPQR